MDRADVAMFRQVSVSQGLMLESVSDSLLAPGGAHFDCPDKIPAVRLATIEAAGNNIITMSEKTFVVIFYFI